MATQTNVYQFWLPTIGGDIDAWGTFLNANFTALDNRLSGANGIIPNLTPGWKVGGVGINATGAEINKLAGLLANTADLNKLNGFTGNTADLNLLAGAAAGGLTAAELLYLANVTSDVQAQLNARQLKVPLLDSFVGLPIVAGDLLYGSGADALARLPKSTDGKLLGLEAGAPAWVEGRRRVITEPVELTGGTVTITGVPEWTNKLTIWLDRMASTTNVVANVRLGTAAGLVTTGYDSYAGAYFGNATNGTTSTIGITITPYNGSYQRGGKLELLRRFENNWVASGSFATTNSGGFNTYGDVTLSDTLDRFAISSGGTFAAGGTVFAVYEE